MIGPYAWDLRVGDWYFHPRDGLIRLEYKSFTYECGRIVTNRWGWTVLATGETKNEQVFTTAGWERA